MVSSFVCALSDLRLICVTASMAQVKQQSEYHHLFFLFCPLSFRSTFLTLHPLFVVVSCVVSFPLSLWLARCLLSLSLQLLTSRRLRLLLSYLSSLNNCFSIVHSRLSSVSSSAYSLFVFAVVCLSMIWQGCMWWWWCVEVSESASRVRQNANMCAFRDARVFQTCGRLKAHMGAF